jgi:hypothetical protein
MKQNLGGGGGFMEAGLVSITLELNIMVVCVLISKTVCQKC